MLMTTRSHSSGLLRGVASLYSLHYPAVLVDALHDSKFRGILFLGWYWQTPDFSWRRAEEKRTRSWSLRLLFIALASAMAVQLLLGAWLIYAWFRYRLAGGWEFGLVLIISYPLVWANILGIATAVCNLFEVKRNGRLLLCWVLEHQVRRLRKRYQFVVVAVAGSVGKTSSKLAIAKVLATEKRVAYQEGNYNDRLTVPLVVFGQDRPASLFDVLGWVKVIARNQRVIRRGYAYDVAVVELGTDGPGQIAEFAYLQPDIAVVTAIAPEHMEYFGSLDAVAKEELGVAAFSHTLLINTDDIAVKYRSDLTTATTYSLADGGDYTAAYRLATDLKGEDVTFHLRGSTHDAKIAYLGAHGVKVVLSAVAVADMLGMEPAKSIAAAQKLAPFAGRMQLLEGKNKSTIIDDTYNSSPVAAKAALDVLYQTKTSKRIAILGSMNEMGESSQAAHEEVGAYCDPTKLAAVATVGAEANQYLAPAAIKRGCMVVEFMSPYEAGEWAVKQLEPRTVVLAKGSQNGVFTEESVKCLLANPSDESKLVRQSKYWLARKRKQFPH